MSHALFGFVWAAVGEARRVVMSMYVRSRRWPLVLLVLGFCHLLVGVGAAVSLVRQPYTTSWLREVSAGAATSPPGERGFTLGGLAWDVDRYATDPSLAPQRALFERFCGATAGLDAAVCVSDVFAERSVAGDPSTEFLAAEYSPAAALAALLGGEPSHCVPRSGNLAAVLLSVGIPARVVQLVGPKLGHTLVEVWDGRWVLYDPMLGATYRSSGELVSAAELASSALVDLVVLGKAPSGTFPASNIVGDQAQLRAVSLVYPEPYLYSRVGESTAMPGFRGAFATVERPGTIVGHPQRAALLSAGGSAALTAVLGAAGLAALRRPRRVGVRHGAVAFGPFRHAGLTGRHR